MANKDYINDPDPNIRALAQMPEGEPLLPPGTVLDPPEYPQDIREALISASIGDALRELREGQGLTGVQLAERLGVNKQRVSALEHLITDQVELATLGNVARALECELEITFRPKEGEAITVIF
ncbi:helix-turn-helix domain-containing protein [Deinococcus sp. UYEF24]